MSAFDPERTYCDQFHAGPDYHQCCDYRAGARLACGDLPYGHGPAKRRTHLPWILLNDIWGFSPDRGMVQWNFCSF
jgi:hypothetical protein